MKKIIALTTAMLLAGSITAYAADAQTTATAVDAKPAAAKTDAAKPAKVDMKEVSYIIGQEMGKGFKSQDIELDVKQLNAGLEAGLSGKESKISEAKSKEIMQAFQMEMIQKAQTKMKAEGEANQKAADAFMADVAKMPNVKKAADGIYYQVITEGKGDVPAKTDTVTVNYTGTTPAADFNKDAKAGAAQLAKGELLGKVFDSSEKTGKPATFPLNQVIPCWTDALSQIPVGSTVILYCAPKQAYGEMAPPQIGPNQVLSFKVELIKAEKAEKPAANDAAATDTQADATTAAE
ncbi:MULTISPECIES: FKBP-type peptidyl-prolyl cis-trans isomerase N-terminal domain-containing protein [Cysteiniphilum]|uniref:Peptidyl-prolyl cis-trans isomerase n=1 Tax=Cysteiniphilum litorale TaxID=2056700 RepID=A0A8J3E957_9GAMM|nr:MULTISPECIES: FKBP-type peptidyl-prolyl cis-trans isomerase [Cysteiniphilum]GGG00851.1 peptidyl-prolyl cis-trans isomerase [Cysteiniphilum litorale]